MLKIVKYIFINVIVFLFLYSILEIFSGQIILKKKIKCSYVLCDANYNYKTKLYSSESILIEYKKDKYGLRGREKSLLETDILVIGGSTTDERYFKNCRWINKNFNFKEK